MRTKDLKTRDGVPFVPGLTVYCSYEGEVLETQLGGSQPAVDLTDTGIVHAMSHYFGISGSFSLVCYANRMFAWNSALDYAQNRQWFWQQRVDKLLAESETAK